MHGVKETGSEEEEEEKKKLQEKASTLFAGDNRLVIYGSEFS